MKYSCAKRLAMILLLLLSTTANAVNSQQCSVFPVFNEFYEKLTSANRIDEAFFYIDTSLGLAASTDSKPELDVSRAMLSFLLTIARVEKVIGYHERCYMKNGHRFAALKLKARFKKTSDDGHDRLYVYFLDKENRWFIINALSWRSKFDEEDRKVNYISIK